MPQHNPVRQQQLHQVLVAKAVTGEALTPAQRADLGVALSLHRHRQQRAALAATAEVPPIWGTLNTSR